MKNQKGFTLIELLVVIAIIGLLSTLAVVSLNNARSRSRDAKRVADVKQMQTALELYYNDCNQYPEQTTAAALTTGENDGCSGSTTLGTFMAQIPSPPQPTDGTCTAYTVYNYESDANGTLYQLSFCLGAQTGELAAGDKCATQAGITNAACAAIP